MSFRPPFVPESRREEESLHDRVTRSRKPSEDTAERIGQNHAAMERDHRRQRPESQRRPAHGARIALALNPSRVL